VRGSKDEISELLRGARFLSASQYADAQIHTRIKEDKKYIYIDARAEEPVVASRSATDGK